MNYPTKNKKIGLAFIPFTFPTHLVLLDITKNDPPGDWTLKKVQSMYEWYEDAVQNQRLPIYGPGATSTVEYVADKTGYPLGEVRLFFLHLYKLTGSGDVNPKYLNQVVPEGKTLTLPWLDKTERVMKWGGALVIGGAIIYFSWPLIAKSFLKRRR